MGEIYIGPCITMGTHRIIGNLDQYSMNTTIFVPQAGRDGIPLCQVGGVDAATPGRVAGLGARGSGRV